MCYLCTRFVPTRGLTWLAADGGWRDHGPPPLKPDVRPPGSIRGKRSGSVCNLRKRLEDVPVEGGERQAALHCQLNEQCVVHCGTRIQRSGQRGLPQRSIGNRLDSETCRQVEFLVSFVGRQD